MEKLIKFIIPIVVIVIILVAVTIVVLKHNIESKQEVEINVASTDMEKIENKNLFYKIDYNIKKYYQYLRGQ